MLACPVCRTPLDELTCRGCGSSYETRDGIPVLLADDVSLPEIDVASYTGLLRVLPGPLRPLAAKAKPYLRVSLTYSSPKRRGRSAAFARQTHGPVLNVGSGTRDYGSHVVNLDLEPAEGVDVIGVAEQLPFTDGSFHGVVLQAVLEHVTDARRALEEIHRVLAPGGRVIVEVPFMQGFHAGPLDHRRYTVQGIRLELEQAGFTVEESGVAVGPASAMCWVTANFLALLLSFRRPMLYRLLLVATGWVAWPVKLLDRWLDTHPMAHVIASGVWAVGVKR